jgi:hypothetical protein
MSRPNDGRKGVQMLREWRTVDWFEEVVERELKYRMYNERLWPHLSPLSQVRSMHVDFTSLLIPCLVTAIPCEAFWTLVSHVSNRAVASLIVIGPDVAFIVSFKFTWWIQSA